MREITIWFTDDTQIKTISIDHYYVEADWLILKSRIRDMQYTNYFALDHIKSFQVREEEGEL